MPIGREDIGASIDLKSAKTVDDLVKIINQYPDTNTAVNARKQLQTQCNYRAVQSSCGNNEQCVKQTTAICQQFGFSDD